MIEVGDPVSWTHVGSGRRTLSMSLREGVVEDITTEREPYEWKDGDKVDMTGRELIIRCTTMHDEDTDFPYVVVARLNDMDDGVIVFDGRSMNASCTLTNARPTPR